jgi:tetratricopeptide (TPR) repeat protein
MNRFDERSTRVVTFIGADVPRQRFGRANNIFFAAWIALTFPSYVACGETPPPKAPTSGVTGAQQGALTANSQTLTPSMGMTDAPSSGQASNRPKMSAAADQKYRAGMQAFQSGTLDVAEAQFQQATESDPKAYQAYYSLGVVRERKSNTTGALSAYAKAIAVVPDYEPAIIAYGVLTAREGKADEAEQYLNGRLAKMEKSAAVTTALAEVKSLRGESGSAQKLAQEALKINPDYRPAMVTLARDHYRSRRLDLALYSLQGILDGYGPENPPRDKDNPEALLIRGLIHKERNERAAAMNDFRRVIELRPDLVEARVHLAGYLLESGNAAEASPQLEWALRYDRDNLLARLNLGDAYRLLGRTNEAKQQLEWVADKDPKLPQVRYSLGLLYLFGESIPGVAPKDAATKAVAAFEEYKRLKPRSTVGQADDADELIAAAKSKKAVIESQEEEAAAAKAQGTQSQPGAPAAPSGAVPSQSPKPESDGSGATPVAPVEGGKE